MKIITKIFFIVFLLASGSEVYSQNVIWRKIIGGPLDETGYNVIETKDKGFLIVGIKQINQIGTNFLILQSYLVKLDQHGNILWEHIYGDSIYSNTSVTVIEDLMGNFYLPYNASQAHLMKMSSNGNVIWDKTYPNQIEYFRGISLVENNKKIVLLSQNNIKGYSTSSITKIDSGGSLIWNKVFYDSIPNFQALRSGNNSFYFTDKNYYLSGAAFSNGFVIKIDTSGNEIWNKRFPNNRGIFSIAPNSDNTFISSAQADISGYLYCLKFNSNGDSIWGKNYKQDSLSWTIGYSKIIKSLNSNFVLGTTSGWNSGRLLVLDSSGLILNSKYYSYPENYSITQNNINNVSDSGYIITGDVGITTSSLSFLTDLLVFKVDKNGKTVLIKNLNQSAIEYTNICAFPNPYNNSFIISFNLNKISAIKINIFDVSGKLIRNLINNFSKPGINEYKINTPELSSGLYLIKIDINKFSYIKKILLIK